MKRLTFWNCKEKNSALPVSTNEIGDTVALEDICAKLATYEDAEEQGRLVVLPCKVGDMVFSLWSRVDSKKQYIRCATVTVVNLMYYLSRIQIGTTFTTRQEAEKALEAMK